MNMNQALSEKQINLAYNLAKERYAELGIDTDKSIDQLSLIPISLHCWQGDDVGGFENPEGTLGGGLAVTGNYPGKARTTIELRRDLDQAYRLIPGTHRLNLHAFYGDADGDKLDRNDWRPHHFDGWIEWAKINNHGIDFNPTCFSHSMADSGFTLASTDKAVRDFWIEHCRLSRQIAAYIGKELGTPAITNVWIPDGCACSDLRQGETVGCRPAQVKVRREPLEQCRHAASAPRQASSLPRRNSSSLRGLNPPWRH